MPVSVTVGKKEYEGTKSNHAEEVMFNSGRHDTGNLTIEMNAWPCTGERHHNCHNLFLQKSNGRTITVVVNEDHGGYAKNHGQHFGAKGTITYANGVATYS